MQHSQDDVRLRGDPGGRCRIEGRFKEKGKETDEWPFLRNKSKEAHSQDDVDLRGDPGGRRRVAWRPVLAHVPRIALLDGLAC